MAINRISGNILQDNLVRGANLAVQGNLIFFDVDNNRVGFATSSPSDLVDAAGNIRVGNTLIEFGGNVDVGNVWINSLQDPVANSDAATKSYVDASSGNVSFDLSDGANTQTVINGDVILFAGVANQTTAVVSSPGSVTISLTESVAIVGNISAANAVIQQSIFAASAEVTGNITTGNISANNTGSFDTVNAATAAVTGNITAGNVSIANVLTTSTIQGNTALTLESVANANITVDSGTGLVVLTSTAGLSLPAGNTLQRPPTPAAGTIRYNSDTQRIELYDGADWDEVVSDVINQTITPTGTDENFALTRPATTASLLVNINGVVQLPNVAYTVAGNIISFAEAPLLSDIIDIRFL